MQGFDHRTVLTYSVAGIFAPYSILQIHRVKGFPFCFNYVRGCILIVSLTRQTCTYWTKTKSYCKHILSLFKEVCLAPYKSFPCLFKMKQKYFNFWSKKLWWFCKTNFTTYYLAYLSSTWKFQFSFADVYMHVCNPGSASKTGLSYTQYPTTNGIVGITQLKMEPTNRFSYSSIIKV